MFFKCLIWGSMTISTGSGKHSHKRIVVNPQNKKWVSRYSYLFPSILNFRTVSIDKKKISKWCKKKKRTQFTNFKISRQYQWFTTTTTTNPFIYPIILQYSQPLSVCPSVPDSALPLSVCPSVPDSALPLFWYPDGIIFFAYYSSLQLSGNSSRWLCKIYLDGHVKIEP